MSNPFGPLLGTSRTTSGPRGPIFGPLGPIFYLSLIRTGIQILAIARYLGFFQSGNGRRLPSSDHNVVRISDAKVQHLTVN